LGQKRTCAVQNAMSALAPKADMKAAAPNEMAANHKTLPGPSHKYYLRETHN
jgi:hypothetical protein